jgi:hypothetical protein
MNRELAPCGTEAAARRHYRHGEAVDEACRVAANRRHAERGGGGEPYRETSAPPPAAARNGLPVVAYEYGKHRYPWAEAAIRRAEAVHGKPEPTADFEAA